MGRSRYRVQRVIDQGAASVVYRARRLDDGGDDVAIKLRHARPAQQARAHAEANAEAAHLAMVAHPNVVRLLDRGEHHGCPFLVLNLVDGEPLSHRIHRGQLAPPEVVACALDLLDALDAVHCAGLLHCDVKPHNIVIGDHDQDATHRARPVLCDFDVAVRLPGMDRDRRRVEATMSGTPEYMSPEQAQGLLLDERSDLYSLGITLFHMATGRPPYQTSHPLATAAMHVSAPLPSPRAIDPRLSPALSSLIVRAAAKAPDERFPSARQMRAALLRLADK